MTQYVSDDQVAGWFGYHAPTNGDVVAAHETIRAEFKALGLRLNNLLPEGSDKTAALRALREAMYQANASIAVAQDIYRP